VQVQIFKEDFPLKIVEMLLSVDHVRFKSIDEREAFRKLNKSIVLDLMVRWFSCRWILNPGDQRAKTK